MKLSNIFKIFCLCGAFLFAACDEVAEEDRLEYRLPEKPVRSVLIEDFTGQRCINCPAMADALNAVADIYGHENVVVVAHHSGNFSKRTPLRNEESMQILATCLSEGQAQPAVMMNRINKNVYSIPSEIADPLAKLLVQYTPITLNATAKVADGKVTVDADVYSDKDAADVVLMAWVLENGIISYQYLDPVVYGSDYEESYVHNHVFRKSLTALDGDAIGNIVAETNIKKTYSVELDQAWNADNLDVVVIAMSKGVVENVIKVKAEK